MQIKEIRNRDIQLPLFENCDWIDSFFSNWSSSIRPFREILYEKGWNGKVGAFEEERVVDLDVLNKAFDQDSKFQPVNVLVGYKYASAFLVFVDLLSSNVNKSAVKLKSLVEYSRLLVETVDNRVKVHDTTVVLLGDKYFNLNEHFVRRLNPNDVFSLLPLTVDEFYERVFIAGYECMNSH